MDKWLQPEFAKLLENKKFTDCHIEVEKESFECHKVILASASEFFERMFLSDFKESQSGKFVLTDVQPGTFAHFLHYVYTYDAKALEKHTCSMVMELLKCGSTWLVESLVSDCVQIMKMKMRVLDITDLVEVFQNAHDIVHEELINDCVYNIRNRFSQKMNCYEILFLTSDVFEQYLIITEGYLPQIERFKMIQTYLTVNGLIGNGVVNGVVGQVELPETTNKDGGQIEKKEDESNDEDDSDSNGKPLTCIEILNTNERETHEVAIPEEPKDKIIHQEYVKTLVGHINFGNMSNKDFYSVVGKSALLNDKEKYEYLYLTK
ncbi:kelch-like protein 40b isoform X2 [Drosophila teissieri]|uniref:kelch-like protein 40b isoform X2 n=1 Tax=Drosophila teissieri TaxID=7243 RepID=UPI001CBA3DF9|nr:kelch-like protein 40b isoform X2 [Drosophila teissieri]